MRIRTATLLILLLYRPITSRAQASPDATTVHRVGDGVSTPKPISMPDPEFSEKARKKKMSGTCSLSIVVTPEGNVKDVKVIHSIAEGYPPKRRSQAISLDQKAIEAVQRYRFEPGLYQGTPVPVAMSIEVNFQIF